jgi:hypothetical protein
MIVSGGAVDEMQQVEHAESSHEPEEVVKVPFVELVRDRDPPGFTAAGGGRRDCADQGGVEVIPSGDGEVRERRA